MSDALVAGPTDEQRAIVESARAFATTLREAQRKTEKQGVSAELRAEWSERDFLRIDWPEVASGFGLGCWTKVMVLEALAFGDAAATLALDRASWVHSPLLRLGEGVWERAGRAGSFVEYAAEDGAWHVDADSWVRLEQGRVRGTIPWVPAAAVDRLYVLFGDQLLGLATGLTATPTAPGALHALGASRLDVDSVPDFVLDLSRSSASRVCGTWRLYLAAVLIGLSEAAATETRKFCLDRVTFGKKVAHHQAVAFLIADMQIAIEAARQLVWQAAVDLDEGGSGRLCHGAFLEASECALFCTNYGVQLHGSHGYVEDAPLEKWLREARAITLMAGGPDAARQELNDTLDEALRSSVPLSHEHPTPAGRSTASASQEASS